jgi:hypothetical protein
MTLEAKQIAQDIATQVNAARARTAGLESTAAGQTPVGDFCSIWPQAKPILELLAGVVGFIPGAGTTAGAVLQTLTKVGDQIATEVCSNK